MPKGFFLVMSLTKRLYICHHCSELVTLSRQSSHSLKCISSTSYVLASPGSQSYNLNSSAALPPDVLPPLEEVFSLICATIRFIPNRAKHAFARALSSSLQRVVSENSLDSWLKLLMLPKCTLPSAKRGDLPFWCTFNHYH